MSFKLYIYTSYFPFTKTSEAFLESEIGFSAGFFKSVTIVPVNKDPFFRPVPSSVYIDTSLAKRSLWKSIKAFFSLLSSRTIRGRDKDDLPSSLKEWKDAIKYLYAANLVYDDLKDRLKDERNPVILYSYWLTYPPIAFSWIKSRFPHKIIAIVSRAHGSDVYSTEVGVYLPLRGLVMNSMDAIFTVSSYGKFYLEKRYGGKAPIIVSRLGVIDNKSSASKENKDVINIVSCSNLIPLKRVSLLFSCLNGYSALHPDKTIIWKHIGDGPLKDEIARQVEKHNSNLIIEFTGAWNNKEVLDYYRNNYIDCYILLSESEGIPVSIMEAISSGIPVISTNVGGVSEIVNSDTGYLLDKEFTQEVFDLALDEILSNQSLKESSYSFFKQNYESKTNYRLFYQSISSILNN